jgi:hypothetical protein
MRDGAVMIGLMQIGVGGIRLARDPTLGVNARRISRLSGSSNGEDRVVRHRSEDV